MKKIVLTVILALLSVFLLPTAASAASENYTVDRVSFTADLRSDGSALINEEWTLTFGESGADGFSREIFIIDDNFERIAGINDMSVSVDGNICSEENSGVPRKGTYAFSLSDGKYSVDWYMPSRNETHVFSMRYVVYDAVKLYNEKAYFYCRAVNEGNNMLCKNVTITVNTPENCFSEEFGIVESGSLAGEKADGCVTFFAGNTVGLIKVGITMPQSLFNDSGLTVIADDNTAGTVVLVVFIVLIVLLLIFSVFYARNYKRIFRFYWKKKCEKSARYESSYKEREQALGKFSPAEILNTVSEKTANEADLFIVTVLELIRRGYISADADGFYASENPEDDTYGRPLDKNEKRVIELFSSGKWSKLIKKPERFYREVISFNKKVRFISPISALTPSGRKCVRYCFELLVSAKEHEFVTPEEISDDFFGNRKYTVPDLIISLINEAGVSEKSDISRFKRNMFMFRDVFNEGKSSELEDDS